jgi:hypothetical protein
MGEAATQGVYKVPVTDSGAADRVFDQGVPESWSPDGRWLAFRARRDEHRRGVARVQGDRKIIPLPPGFHSSFSPDGRFLTYGSYETGASEIWIRSLTDGSFVRQVSVDGGFEPRWVGDHIFYRKGRQWFSSRVTSLQPQVEWEPPQPVFETDFLDTPGVSYAVSPDGQRLFVVRSTHEPTVSRLVFVQNWFEELKGKVAIPSRQ